MNWNDVELKWYHLVNKKTGAYYAHDGYAHLCWIQDNLDKPSDWEILPANDTRLSGFSINIHEQVQRNSSK